MATYRIVDKDKDPLGPNEINAGETILVNDGDVFIVDPTADDDIEFESASGSSTDFEVQINASNTNSIEIKVKESLNPEITVADNVDLTDVKLDAKDADSLDLTIGDNVTLEELKGSEDGDDTIVIGDGFTTDKKIETKDGNDSITIGDDADIDDIDVGDGNNSIVIGDNATLKDIKTGDGDDVIVIGDGLTADDIETKDGDDSITIGDDANVDDIKTDKGDDTINLGDDFTGDKVEAGDGDDIVRIGTGADIDKLDGGKGIDTLASPEDYPDARNFEVVVCFVRGTRIRTEHGEIPVEQLKVGDRVMTADRGFQAIRWIGSSKVVARGPLAPVRIKKGAYGNSRDLWVSQQHRIQLAGWRVELLFGSPECLIPAKFLVNGDDVQLVESEQVEYFHILFDGHEVIYSEGIPTESFHPGDWSLSGMDQAAREEIFAIFPHLRGDTMTFGPSARPSLQYHEGKMLREASREPDWHPTRGLSDELFPPKQ